MLRICRMASGYSELVRCNICVPITNGINSFAFLSVSRLGACDVRILDGL